MTLTNNKNDPKKENSIEELQEKTRNAAQRFLKKNN